MNTLRFPADIRRAFCSSLERLESRIAPAVVLTMVDLDGDGTSDDIRLVGDGLKNIVQIQDNGSNALIISIDADGNGNTTGPRDLPPTNFLFTGGSVALEVKLGGGNDQFTYAATGNFSAASRLLNVELGPGGNTFGFSMGNFDVLNTSRISLDVTGSTLFDNVTVQFDEVRKSAVTLNLPLGAGNDTTAVSFDRIDDGSSVDIGADLGPGNNTLTIDFQEIGFGDHGTASTHVIGGINKDTVTLNLHDDFGDGTKTSLMNFSADLGAGDDVFTANLDYAGNVFRIDDHSVAAIDVNGGAGNDSLSVKGVGAAGTIRIDPDARLAVTLDGGAGNDTITADLGKTDALELIGEVRLRLSGGLGNDILTAMLAHNANSTGNYDLGLIAGAGNDRATFILSTGIGTTTFGPTGKALLDGGLGTDMLTNGSKQISTATAFEQII